MRAVCPDGSRKVQCDGGVYPVEPFGTSNPFQTVALFKNREGVWRIIGTGRASWDVVASPRHTLTLLANGGGDVFTQRNEVFSPPELQFEQVSGLPGSSALGYSQNQNFNINGNVVHRYRAGAGSSFTSGMEIRIRHSQRTWTRTPRAVAGYC